MKRSSFLLSCLLLAVAAPSATAQVVPSAEGNRVSVTVGVTGSVFQPDYAFDWACGASTCPPGLYYPVAQASNYPLIGPGAYVDVRLRRWIQFEGEARWMRFNRYADIHQDNYLAGPRIPVYHFWKANLYGKALGGFSRMDLGAGVHGSFTTVAFGGGMDIKLTRKISIRAFDGEYQYWPSWGNSKLFPYGASAGIGYKIF